MRLRSAPSPWAHPDALLAAPRAAVHAAHGERVCRCRLLHLRALSLGGRSAHLKAVFGTIVLRVVRRTCASASGSLKHTSDAAPCDAREHLYLVASCRVAFFSETLGLFRRDPTQIANERVMGVPAPFVEPHDGPQRLWVFRIDQCSACRNQRPRTLVRRTGHRRVCHATVLHSRGSFPPPRIARPFSVI